MPTVGFIHDEYSGVMQQGHTDIQAAFHPAREFGNRAGSAIFQPDELQHFFHTAVQFVALQAIHLAPEAQVGSSGDVFVEGDFLGHDAKLSLGRLRILLDGIAHQPDIAGVRRQQAGDHSDCGRLASAVWPEQAEDLARLKVKADAANGVNVPKVFIEIQDCNGWTVSFVLLRWLIINGRI